MPKECVFNEELALDTLFIKGQAILHVVDTRTHFSSAVYLRSQCVEGVWAAFIDAWATMYVGYPNRMRADQGSIFTSARWSELTNMNGIELSLSGIESHNSIGAGERYRSPLRRIHEKITFDYPRLDPHLALKLAVKAMNDTMGPEGLVPSLSVLGILPRFPASNTKLPNQVGRMHALRMARAEMETISCELKVRLALNSQVPPAANLNLEIGQMVLVHRENNSKAAGPFKIVDICGKQIFIIDEKSQRKQFNIAQIRPYYVDPHEAHLFHLSHLLSPLKSDPRSCTFDVV